MAFPLGGFRQNPALTAAPSGPAGGDLTGTYPSPTVKKIYGYPVNVRDPTYGATGNGVTDDTAAIQAAIAAAVALVATYGGAAIYFPAGVYLVSAKLTIDASGITVYGDGPISIIKLAAGTGTNLMRVNTSTDLTGNTRLSKFTIRDIALDHNNQAVSDPTTVVGNLVCFSIDYLHIEGVTFLNSRDVAAECVNSQRVQILSCIVDTVTLGTAGNGFNCWVSNGPSVTNAGLWGDYTVSNCFLRGVADVAIFVGGTNTKRLSIVNNVVRGLNAAGADGIMNESGAVPNADITITGNVVEGCGGIGIGVSNSSGFATPWSSHVALSDNTVTNCGVGLQVTDRLAAITGNVVTDVNEGIRLGANLSVAATDFIVTGNLVAAKPGATGNGLIYTVVGSSTQTAQRAVIANNEFLGAAAPPTVRAVTVLTGAGSVDNGTHVYGVTFVSAAGESLPSVISNVVTNDATHKTNTVENIPLGPIGTTQRKLYRSAAGLTALKLLATIADNTTTSQADTATDASLGAVAPTAAASSSANGILLESKVANVLLRGNIVHLWGLEGISLLASGTTTPTEIRIQGNRVTDNGVRGVGNQSGIFVDPNVATSRITISDNRVYDTGPGTQPYSLNIQGTVTNCRLIDNELGGGVLLSANVTGYVRGAGVTTITPSAYTPSPAAEYMIVLAANANVAYTINAPPVSLTCPQLVFVIQNTSGGIYTAGNVGFNAVFHKNGGFPGALFNNNKQRTITFACDGTQWVETSRVDADL